jgi:hypothetical protein
MEKLWGIARGIVPAMAKNIQVAPAQIEKMYDEGENRVTQERNLRPAARPPRPTSIQCEKTRPGTVPPTPESVHLYSILSFSATFN